MILARSWILFAIWAVLTALLWSILPATATCAYGVASVAGLALLLGAFRQKHRLINPRRRLRALVQRRFRDPLPQLFLACLVVSGVAGASYPVTNIDTLTYRAGRIGEWLQGGGWHWIRTIDPRENLGAVVQEFIWLPLWLIEPHGRLLFLPNLISFALLPGACFLVLRGSGVGFRAARQWAYVLPMGWCFIHAAAGTVNDLVAATFVAWGLGLLMRWSRCNSARDLTFSLLAMSLGFGTKQTTWFLALPYAGLLLSTLASEPTRLSILRRLWWRVPAVVSIVVAASPVPSLVMNLRHTGSLAGWQAAPGSHASVGFVFVGNLFNLFAQNLMPPIFPIAPQWNNYVKTHLLKALPGDFSLMWRFGELPTSLSELSAGFGLLPCLLVIVSLVVCLTFRLKGERRDRRLQAQAMLLSLSLPGMFCILGFLDLGGMARYCSPYYLPVVCSALGLFDGGIVSQRKWWVSLVVINSMFAVLLSGTLRQRPLWPISRAIEALPALLPNSGAARQLAASYTFSSDFQRDVASILNTIPKGRSTVALTENFMKGQAYLIRPDLRFHSVPVAPSKADLVKIGAEYAIVDVKREFGSDEKFEMWLIESRLRLIGRFRPLALPSGERFDVALTRTLHADSDLPWQRTGLEQ